MPIVIAVAAGLLFVAADPAVIASESAILVNAAREDAGLPPVQLYVEGLHVAQARAAAQALGQLDHAGAISAENLVRLTASADASAVASVAHDALLASPPHRDVMLHPDIAWIAVGAVEQDDGTIVIAQLYWV